MTGPISADPVYAITLHQPWASLIALGIKTVETRSWPAPARLLGQRIAVHAGKRLVRRPDERIERELVARWGEDWPLNIQTSAVVATAVLAGMAQVARAAADHKGQAGGGGGGDHHAGDRVPGQHRFGKRRDGGAVDEPADRGALPDGQDAGAVAEQLRGRRWRSALAFPCHPRGDPGRLDTAMRPSG